MRNKGRGLWGRQCRRPWAARGNPWRVHPKWGWSWGASSGGRPSNRRRWPCLNPWPLDPWNMEHHASPTPPACRDIEHSERKIAQAIFIVVLSHNYLARMHDSSWGLEFSISKSNVHSTRINLRVEMAVRWRGECTALQNVQVNLQHASCIACRRIHWYNHVGTTGANFSGYLINQLW